MTDPSEHTAPDQAAANDAPPPPSVPAGWYPTPDGKQRYWDGAKWADLPWSDPATTIPASEDQSTPTPSGLSRGARIAILVGASAIVLIVIISFISVTLHNLVPSTFTAHGTFELLDTEDGGACDPPNGYTDLTAGAQVIITAGGKTVGIGELSSGKKTEAGLACDYTFTVKDVPLGHKFYGVEITHRGVVQESLEDMKSGNVALSIGS